MDHFAPPLDLKGMIDMIDVPVFVIERDLRAHFRIIAINDSHTRVSGLDHEEYSGSTADDILTPDEAAAVNARYATCFDRWKPVSYRERLSFTTGAFTFETTLKPVPGTTARGMTRVVGTARVIRQHALDAESLAYRLAQSQGALETLERVTETVCRNGTVGPVERNALETLTRSLGCSLAELRDALDAGSRVDDLARTSGRVRARDALFAGNGPAAPLADRDDVSASTGAAQAS